MSSLVVPRGDYGFDLVFTVLDAGSVAYPLTGYTVTLKVWRQGSPDELLVEGACTIDGADAHKCRYTVKQGDFDEVGRYRAELELTKAGVVESTRYYTIEVEESG